MARENMFAKNSLSDDAKASEEARQETEAKLSNQELPVKKGRPIKRTDATTITLCISRDYKKRVKEYAARHQLTVSDLLREWIDEHCPADGEAPKTTSQPAPQQVQWGVVPIIPQGSGGTGT